LVDHLLGHLDRPWPAFDCQQHVPHGQGGHGPQSSYRLLMSYCTVSGNSL
jgi:hypothetical protein